LDISSGAVRRNISSSVKLINLLPRPLHVIGNCFVMPGIKSNSSHG
jgi:hypothetical protein